jgi:hypothetical protein
MQISEQELKALKAEKRALKIKLRRYVFFLVFAQTMTEYSVTSS